MTDSSSNNKRIAKNTLILYVRMLFMMIVSLYTSRVVLDKLGVEDFGIYNVVGGVVSMFAFLNQAMVSSTQRYITYALGNENKVELRKYFVNSILIHAFISVFIIIIAETVGLWFLYEKLQIPSDRFIAAQWVFQFVVLSTVVLVMSAPYNADIIAHERMKVFAYVSVLEVSLKLLIVFTLSLVPVDRLIVYAFLLFLVQCIIRYIYSYYCKKHFLETTYNIAWDKKVFKEMLCFASWNMLGGLSGVCCNQGLNILLNIFFGPVVNAARGVAMQVQSTVILFANNFQMAMNPQITKYYARGELDLMHKLVIRSSKYSFFLLLVLSLPLMVGANPILSLWLKEVPEWSVQFVRIILMIIIVDVVANPLMISSAATGSVKVYQTVRSFIMLSVLPIAYIVLKSGAAPSVVFIVHLVICIFAFITRLYIVAPMIALPKGLYVKKALLPCFYVAIPSTLFVGYMYSQMKNHTYMFILWVFMSFIVTSFFIYALGMTQKEKIVVRARVIEKLKRFKQ